MTPPDPSINPRAWSTLVRSLSEANKTRDSEADATLRGWYRDEGGSSPIFCISCGLGMCNRPDGHYNPTRPAHVADRLTSYRPERVAVALLFHASCAGDRW